MNSNDSPVNILLKDSSSVDKYDNITVSFAMRVMWSYIDNLSESPLKDNLIEAFLIRIHEMINERPCFFGRIGRILDIPSGIDFSIDDNMPDLHSLKLEIQRMAAEINNDFEDFGGNFVEQIEHDINENHISCTVNPSAIMSEIKRESLIHKAQVTLVQGRNVPESYVNFLVDQVFPEGAIL